MKYGLGMGRGTDPAWLGARLRRVPPRELPRRALSLGTWVADRWSGPPSTPPGPPPQWRAPWGDLARVALPSLRDQAPAGTALDVLGPGWDTRLRWGPQRLQHHALTAAADTDDPDTVRAAFAWMWRHPPPQGLAWSSSLEVALRLISLVWLRHRRGVHTHAWWLLRHPTTGHAARNHRVAELAALAVAAAALPDLPDATAWRDAAEALPDVLHNQLHRDGVGVEQSTGYLSFVLEAAHLAAQCGIAGLDAPLQRGAAFLDHLLDATGRAVSIGDDDDGRVVPSALLLGHSYSQAVVRKIRPTGSPVGSRTFAAGGLTALRHDTTLVVFDHGPLGEPHLGAHGHADCLSCWVHTADGPVIVGRGTGLYTGDPEARRFHRGTAAHPTVVVHGADQSIAHQHPFLWRTRATPTLLATDPQRGRVSARHDGYARFGITHTRTVTLGADGVSLTDALDGTGHPPVEVMLPLAAGLTLADNGWVVRGDRRILRLMADPQCRVRTITGGPRPGPGWHSDQYGAWEPATTVILQAEPTLPARLHTRLLLP